MGGSWFTAIVSRHYPCPPSGALTACKQSSTVPLPDTSACKRVIDLLTILIGTDPFQKCTPRSTCPTTHPSSESYASRRAFGNSTLLGHTILFPGDCWDWPCGHLKDIYAHVGPITLASRISKVPLHGSYRTALLGNDLYPLNGRNLEFNST